MCAAFPLSFDTPAFACWIVLFPLRNSTFLTVGLPTSVGPQRGFHVAHA